MEAYPSLHSYLVNPPFISIVASFVHLLILIQALNCHIIVFAVENFAAYSVTSIYKFYEIVFFAEKS